MLDYFFSGGPLFMGLLTLLLIATIGAAIKFPQYTKDLGQLAIAVGILGLLLGLLKPLKLLRQVVEWVKECGQEDKMRFYHAFSD